MSMQLATQQIRMDQWAQIIHARNESGLTVRDYCDQNGLSENAYFYWLRKIRASAIEASGGQFAELVKSLSVKSLSGRISGEAVKRITVIYHLRLSSTSFNI